MLVKPAVHHLPNLIPTERNLDLAALESDLLAITGQVDIQGGLVQLSLLAPFLPSAGDSISFLSAAGGVTGTPEALSLALSGVDGTVGLDAFDLISAGNSLAFSANQNLSAGDAIIFQGGSLADVFGGGVGADVLAGGGGGDLLTGCDGSDLLAGGTGRDTLTGESGQDTFVLVSENALSAGDLITDFMDGVDLLGLTDGLAFADLDIANIGRAEMPSKCRSPLPVKCSLWSKAICLRSDEFEFRFGPLVEPRTADYCT